MSMDPKKNGDMSLAKQALSSKQRKASRTLGLETGRCRARGRTRGIHPDDPWASLN